MPPPALAPRDATERPKTRGPAPAAKNRVEAESGEIVNSFCGDKPVNEQMEVWENSNASGGHEVFHPGERCIQQFPGQAGQTVSTIVYSLGGRDGQICGHFRITGGQVGVSTRICGTPFGWQKAPVTVKFIDSGPYRIEWVPDPDGENYYANAHVDYHELTPGPLPV